MEVLPDFVGYVVERLDTSRTNWQKVGTTEDVEITVTKLNEGKQYLFKVSAENKYGVSEPAITTEPALAKNPYSECSLLFRPYFHA